MVRGARPLTVPSCLDTHLMAVMIRLSAIAAFSFRIAIATSRPKGDPGGAKRSFWVTSTRIISPLLSPHASFDAAGDRT